MTEDASQNEDEDDVIRTPDDLAKAFTRKFLTAAEADDNEANDDFVHELIEWKRANQ